MVSETKTDETDIISIDGYSYNSKPRRQKYVRKSGGLGVFVKDELNKYVDIIESESEYVFWIKISKIFTKLDQDIVLGSIYVPPSQSREFENFRGIL